LLRRIARIGTYAVALALIGVAWFAWSVFNAGTSTTDPATPRVRPSPAADVHTTKTYADLRVFQDTAGHFAGTILMRNHTAHDETVVVTVNMYDGDQNVGRVSGMVTLKPTSESKLELTGFDDFTRFTESRVRLL